MEPKLGATTHEPIEISDSSKEDKEEGVGVVCRILEVIIDIGQTT